VAGQSVQVQTQASRSTHHQAPFQVAQFASTDSGIKMTNPEILIGEETREMTDEEAANYLQVIGEPQPLPSPE
jgi:hypothetical protein